MMMMSKQENSNTRKQSIKSRPVLTSMQFQSNRLASRKPSSNKHCSDDIACIHCCSCWLNFQQEYNKRIKYFQGKVTELTSQNVLLKQCLEKIASENQKLKFKLKNCTDLELIRQKIRKQLKEEFDSEIKMKILLQEEKIKQLTKKLQQSQTLNEQLENMNDQLGKELSQTSSRLKNLTSQYETTKATLTKQIQTRENQIAHQSGRMVILCDQLRRLEQKICSMESVIAQKESSIRSMKSTIDHSGYIIDQQMSKMAQKQSQKNHIQFQFATKSQQLIRMQKITQQHSKSISMLSSQKNKLFSLVGSLKDELLETDQQNYILKLALNEAEFVARQKSISLQNLKYDVSQLKYTLI